MSNSTTTRFHQWLSQRVTAARIAKGHTLTQAGEEAGVNRRVVFIAEKCGDGYETVNNIQHISKLMEYAGVRFLDFEEDRVEVTREVLVSDIVRLIQVGEVMWSPPSEDSALMDAAIQLVLLLNDRWKMGQS